MSKGGFSGAGLAGDQDLLTLVDSQVNILQSGLALNPVFEGDVIKFYDRLAVTFQKLLLRLELG